MVRHLRTRAGEVVVTDPEVITVVSYDRRGAAPFPARRLHAELCERYQQQARRAETSAEMKEFTKRGRRGTGL